MSNQDLLLEYGSVLAMTITLKSNQLEDIKTDLDDRFKLLGSEITTQIFIINLSELKDLDNFPLDQFLDYMKSKNLKVVALKHHDISLEYLGEKYNLPFQIGIKPNLAKLNTPPEPSKKAQEKNTLSSSDKKLEPQIEKTNKEDKIQPKTDHKEKKDTTKKDKNTNPLTKKKDDDKVEKSTTLAKEIEEIIKKDIQPLQPDTQPRKSLIIDKPIRSGQTVYAQNADLIITSMVSEGAEVYADGNIHIYGQLRGRAMAGVSGDATARIFVHNMRAQIVSIAGEYCVLDKRPTEAIYNKPTCISLKNGKFVFSPIED